MTMTEPGFREEWFFPASQKALGDLYLRVDHLAGDVIEIGSWEGRSTIALANACHPAIVHAVDTWQGSPGEVSADLAKDRDVFSQFAANIDRYTAGNVEAHRMGWREFFTERRDPVRFCFIDAEHSYREVKENVEAVLPLMVPGGIITGDDVHHPPVQQAVIDVFGDANVTATLWWVQV